MDKFVKITQSTPTTKSVTFNNSEIGVLVITKNRVKFNPVNPAVESLKGSYDDTAIFKKKLFDFLEHCVELLSSCFEWNNVKRFDVLYRVYDDKQKKYVYSENKPLLLLKETITEYHNVILTTTPLKSILEADSHYNIVFAGQFNNFDSNNVDIELIPNIYNTNDYAELIENKFFNWVISSKIIVDSNTELKSINLGKIIIENDDMQIMDNI
jgi:hypothetical protein